MYEVKLINKKGQAFIKEFDSLYLLNQFKNKVKRGNNLVITSIIKVY